MKMVTKFCLFGSSKKTHKKNYLEIKEHNLIWFNAKINELFNRSILQFFKTDRKVISLRVLVTFGLITPIHLFTPYFQEKH